MAAASSSSFGFERRDGLVDDTMDAVDPLPEATIKRELAKIAQFRTNRSKGYHWAAHQLKVLVSDEEEEDDADDEHCEGQDGGSDLTYDSDDSADVERYAIELSLQGTGSQARSSRPKATRRNTSDKEVSQCPRCSIYPRFSPKRRTRQFRLVEPWEYSKSGDEFEVCDHFVAVSYCWSSYEASSRTCQIRDCTGSRAHNPRSRSSAKGKSRDDNVYLSTENGRVPFDEVLDRAVEFASSEGLRCIWIDQACLPQDESDEHQTGVQSMDMVYQRARHTIGLLGSSIDSQDELVSLSTMFAWARSYTLLEEVPGQDWWNLHFFKHDQNGLEWGFAGDGMPKVAQAAVAKNVCRAVVGILQRIMDDRWYTRAWILQESISAGKKLNLLLRVPPGLNYQPSRFMDPDGRLITEIQQEGSTLILTWREFDNLKKGLFNMLNEFYDLNSADFEHAGDGDNGMLCRALDLTSPERIPRPHPIHDSCGIVNCGCNSSFVCNAACAISLLKGRHCLKAEDKAAIVANLCNYEIRLDTFQLAKRFKSLRLCLIALALLNADLSLLVPQFFNLASGIDDTVPLFQVPYMNLHKVNKYGVEPENMPRIQVMSQPCLTPGGMMLPAFLWCVDREVDFAPIRIKWAEQWWAMKSLRQSSSSVYTTWWRKGSKEADRILNNIRRRCLDGHPLRGHKDDKYPGVLFSASVAFPVFQRSVQANAMIGEIVRDTLSYLLHSDEHELANSVWQSLRSHKFEMGECKILFPDKIDETMLKDPDFGRYLQLNHTPDAAFAQEWLFDRVVLRGKLWVGHYVPSRTEGSGFASVQPFAVISNDIYGARAGMRVYKHSTAPPEVQGGHSMVANTLDIVRDAQSQTPENRRVLGPWLTKPMSFDDSSVIARHAAKAALYESMRFWWRSPDAFASLDSARILGMAAVGLSPSHQAHLHYMETYVGWDIAQQELRVRRRRSAFDVDGPCLVATPYDATRERIPHYEERTLSSCWVVETKGMDMTDEEVDWIRKEFVRHRRAILGGSPAPVPKFSDLELDNVPEHVVEDVRALRLKVLRQVQGVWDIIDPAPFQSFLFS